MLSPLQLFNGAIVDKIPIEIHPDPGCLRRMGVAFGVNLRFVFHAEVHVRPTAFYMVCSTVGEDVWQNGDRVVSSQVGVQTPGMLRELALLRW
jgi:hypothetical protein